MDVKVGGVTMTSYRFSLVSVPWSFTVPSCNRKFPYLDVWWWLGWAGVGDGGVTEVNSVGKLTVFFFSKSNQKDM